jgi:hypothetical protein
MIIPRWDSCRNVQRQLPAIVLNASTMITPLKKKLRVLCVITQRRKVVDRTSTSEVANDDPIVNEK